MFDSMSKNKDGKLVLEEFLANHSVPDANSWILRGSRRPSLCSRPFRVLLAVFNGNPSELKDQDRSRNQRRNAEDVNPVVCRNKIDSRLPS